MEELYVENFSKNVHASTIIDTVLPSEIKNLQNPKKSEDFLIDLTVCLNRLEKEIERQYVDFKDYRFIFSNLKEKIKRRNIQEIIPLLDELEELLDLSLEDILLKKDLEVTAQGVQRLST